MVPLNPVATFGYLTFKVGRVEVVSRLSLPQSPAQVVQAVEFPSLLYHLISFLTFYPFKKGKVFPSGNRCLRCGEYHILSEFIPGRRKGDKNLLIQASVPVYFHPQR